MRREHADARVFTSINAVNVTAVRFVPYIFKNVSLLKRTLGTSEKIPDGLGRGRGCITHLTTPPHPLPTSSRPILTIKNQHA